jgi:D-tagatose-1,6-bisphosphate aldolase subunit GatZ/KbaZ
MKEIIKAHKQDGQTGICSVCSAHPLVIEAALRLDLKTQRSVLIEATSNQVNQFGGYTFGISFMPLRKKSIFPRSG